MSNLKAKDYELIAGVMAECQGLSTLMNDKVFGKNMSKTVAIVAGKLANYLEEDNPKFDRNKFLIACGIEVSVKGEVPATFDGGKTYWQGGKQHKVK